nr:hypothetical protein [Tepidanaerobacter syntrophicus]
MPRDFDKILGTEQIEKVINIDQSPIGRTPRSNPATYINVFNDIREVFSMTPDRECADISRADSALMSAAANVKPAKVMV